MDIKVFGGWPGDFSATCGLLACCPSKSLERGKHKFSTVEPPELVGSELVLHHQDRAEPGPLTRRLKP
jgi:hypothetical protein